MVDEMYGLMTNKFVDEVSILEGFLLQRVQPGHKCVCIYIDIFPPLMLTMGYFHKLTLNLGMNWDLVQG